MAVTEPRVRGRARGGPSPYPTRLALLWRSVGAVFVVLTFVPPLVLLVSGSFRRTGLPPPPTPELWPNQASVQPYERAIVIGGLLRATTNSLIVAAIAVPAQCAGRFPRRIRARPAAAAGGRCIVVVASLVALMVPATALLVPRFAIFRGLGLTDTLAPLIAPALLATSPLYVLVYYLAFRAVPAEHYDACRVEDLTPCKRGGGWRCRWSDRSPRPWPR